MATRETLYERFGPLLIEALVLTIKEEINIVRAELNLPERSNSQVVNAINNKLNTLIEYEWMQE